MPGKGDALLNLHMLVWYMFNLKNAVSLPMHWSLKEQYGFDEVTLNTVSVIPAVSKMNIP